MPNSKGLCLCGAVSIDVSGSMGSYQMLNYPPSTASVRRRAVALGAVP